MKENLLKYYWKFKEIYKLGKELGFGQGQIASNFTECLCRYLFDLKEYNGKDFDATKDGNNIEIKATLGKGTTTQVNLSKQFNFLYWLNLDLDDDKIKVIIYDYEQIKSSISEREREKDRSNLNFNNVEKYLYKTSFKIERNDIQRL